MEANAGIPWHLPPFLLPINLSSNLNSAEIIAAAVRPPLLLSSIPYRLELVSFEVHIAWDIPIGS